MGKQDVPTFELLSNRGSESAQWSVSEPRPEAGEHLSCDVRLRGQYYADGEHPEDLEFVARDLFVLTANLEQLVQLLRSWLDLSLPQQSRTPLDVSEELGGRFDNQLTLKLGRRADTLSGQNLVATLTYSLGRFCGEFSFVTDQSCLRIFCDGIRSALK
jgi:hypothetical protein